MQEHELPCMIDLKNVYINEKSDFKYFALETYESQQQKIDKHLKDLKCQIKSQIQKEQQLKMGLRPLKSKKMEEKKKKQMKRFYSPEEFENIHSVLQLKHVIDSKKAEIFNLGMIIL